MSNQPPKESPMMSEKKVKENKNFLSKLKTNTKKAFTVAGTVLLVPVAGIVCTALFPFSCFYYLVSSIIQREFVSAFVPQQAYKENNTLWSKLTLNAKKTLGTAAILWALPFLAVFHPRSC